MAYSGAQDMTLQLVRTLQSCLTLHSVDEAVLCAEHPKLCLQGVLDKRSVRLGRQCVHESHRCDNYELILVASEAL